MNQKDRHNQKYSQILFHSKLAIRFLAEMNRAPDTIIRSAIEKANDKEQGSRTVLMNLPEQLIKKLKQELFDYCKEVYPNEEAHHLEALADDVLSSRVAVEPKTRILALKLYYMWLAGHCPNLNNGSQKKKNIQSIADEHGVSGQVLYRNFNKPFGDINSNRRLCRYLEKVVPMLSEYPDAQGLAEDELLSRKNKVTSKGY